jgi:hypothetical protein
MCCEMHMFVSKSVEVPMCYELIMTESNKLRVGQFISQMNELPAQFVAG